MAEKVLLQEFTRPAFEEYLEQEPNPVAIIPLGSVEQHGPHLPLGTDTYTALSISKEVANRTNSIVVQPCWPGYSPHHMGFAGTITFRAETLINIIIDTVDSLVEHGIRKIMILNGHGGNAQIAAHAARQARRRTGAIVLMPTGPMGGNPEDMLQKVDVHAGAGETATALALFPDLVEMYRVDSFEPTASFAPQVEALRQSDDPHADIRTLLVMAYIGDTHEFTSSGVYGFTDPNDADVKQAQDGLNERIDRLVKLIEYWKTIDLP
ncbi:MAG: creatininase family protein [Bacillota bacterium]